jgi:hypothetical protein
MRLHLRLGLALGAAASIMGACGHHHESAPPPPSSLTGSGGTRGGGAGRGGAGSSAAESGSAGQSGEAGDGAGASAGARQNGRGGTGGTGGEAGAAEIGGGGVPYSGDMGSGGSGGAAGAPEPGDGAGHLFVGPGGYDGGLGTREQPFLTLAGAVSVAKAGDTIVFLDGTYAIPKRAAAVTIPHGVKLAAENPRLASLVGDGGTLLEFAGNSEVDGLSFDGFETVIAASGNDASVSVTRTTFSNCASDSGKSALEIGGDTLVTVTDEPAHDLGDCAALAHVYDHGKLTLDGELLHFAGDAGSAVFTAEDQAKLELSNLNAEDGDLPLLALGGDSVTTLATATVVTRASHVVELAANASLAVTSSSLALDASVTDPAACIDTSSGAASTLTLTGAVLHDCQGALVGPSPKTLLVDHTEILDMTESALELTSGSPSSVTLADSFFHNAALRAVRLGGGTFALVVRGTRIDAVPSGFELDGDAASSFDFGTLADPGDNVLTATTTALDVQNPAIAAVSAVGNTWTPNVQNADADGHYAPASSPGVLEVTSGSGQNYSDSAGAAIRLAESN